MMARHFPEGLCARNNHSSFNIISLILISPHSKNFFNARRRLKEVEVMKKLILALLLILMAATLAAGDTIYLRDGRTVSGTVLGFVNGRFAVRLTNSLTNNGPSNPAQNTGGRATTNRVLAGETGDILFIRPNEIERIEIDGRSLDEARFITRSVDVALGPNWVDSGVDLRRGDHVQVRAAGTIYAGRTRITPEGLRSTDPNAPLPRAAEGVLIGAVGNDASAPITELGTSREFVADRDGRLYLTANRSGYTDARGSYQVQVRTERELPGRNANARNNAGRVDDNQNNDDYDPFGNGSNAQGRVEPAPVRPRSGNILDQQSGQNRNRAPLEKTIEVAANLARGVDTGIDLRSGDQVQITASGNVTAGRRAGVVSPDGGRVGAAATFGAGTYPVPTAGVGALIGYIRLTNGQLSQPFLIGSQQTFTAPADGRLFLLVNDDNYNDNSGSFSVRLIYPDALVR
jgi:hypothetical protein